MNLKMLHVFDSHFNYFRLFNPATTLLHVDSWKKTGQIGQTVVHAITASFLDDAVRLRISGRFLISRF